MNETQKVVHLVQSFFRWVKLPHIARGVPRTLWGHRVHDSRDKPFGGLNVPGMKPQDQWH